MKIKHLVLWGIFVLPLFANANEKDQQRANLESLVQCKATINDFIAFDKSLSGKRIRLVEEKALSPWGGIAWKVTPPISVGGVQSDIALMTDRFSFYILMKSSNPSVDSQAVIKALNLEKQMESGGYFKFNRSENDRTIIVSSHDKADANYLVGCSYPQNAFSR